MSARGYRKPKGMGDVVKAITSVTGIEYMVNAMANAVGIEDCGCGKRQELLNNKIPFGKTKQEDHAIEKPKPS